MKFPLQRISYKEKMKNESDWGKQILDYIFQFSNERTDVKQNQLWNYRLYNNILNQKDFERDCNRMGIEVGQFKDAIQPYNKIPNKVNVMLGEELLRPYKYTVALLDHNGIRKKEEKKSTMLIDWMTTHLASFAVQQQLDQLNQRLQLIQQQAQQQQSLLQVQQEQQPQQQLQQQPTPNVELMAQEMGQLQMKMQELEKKKATLVPPEEINKWFKTTYRDAREIMGSKLLTFLWRSNKLDMKRNEGFKHAIISDEERLWVGVKDNVPTVEVVNPLEFFEYRGNNKYSQDGVFAGRRYYMSPIDVITKYGDYLKEEEIKRLENISIGAMVNKGPLDMSGRTPKEYSQNMFNTVESNYWASMPENNEFGQYGERKSSDYLVMHAEWLSLRDVGFLTYIDEDGNKTTTIVDENFELPELKTKEPQTDQLTNKNGYNQKDKYKSSNTGKSENSKNQCWYFLIGEKEFKYEQEWIPQVWEGTRIGNDIYCCIQPKRYSYFSIDRPNTTKLGYHGVVYNNTNAQQTSLVDRMKPYQYLYFIIMQKLKKLIAQDRGKVYHLDATMIPESIGLEKAIYYMEELGIDIYNPLRNAELPGAMQRGKVTQTSDLSTMQYIMQYINLLQYIDMMISDAAGITKGREGFSAPTSTATAQQSDLQQSAVITEIYFSIHNNLWEETLNSLLSVARRFYKENDVQYIQYVLDDLSIETINLAEEDLEDCDLGVFVTDSIRENDVFGTLKQISQALIQNDKANMSHIISILEANSLAELKRDMKTFEEEQSQKEQQMQQAQMDMQKMIAEEQRQTMREKEALQTEREIKKAEIMVFSRQQDLDVNNDGTPDPLQISELKHKMNTDLIKNEQADRALDIKEKELEIKRKALSKRK